MKSIRKKYWVIYLSLLVLLISPTLVYHILEGQPLEALLALVMQGAKLSIPMVLFHKKPRWYFYLLLPFAVLAPLALIPPVLFGLELNTDIVNLVINTNPGEAYELFGSMLLVIFTGLLLYVAIYIFLIRRSKKQLTLRTGAFISVAGVLLFLLLSLVNTGFRNPKGAIKAGVVDYYPTSTVYSFMKFSSMIRKVDHAELIKDFSFGVSKQDTLAKRQIYVLVLGETARYHNWGINGYARNTTPRLAARENVLSFSNVATGASLTEESVPIIITRASADDFDRHFREKSIDAAFAEAGFQTFWITNQIQYLNIKMHMDQTENLVTAFGSYTTRKSVYDIVVVDELRKVLRQHQDSNLFILLHTMGSHFNYAQRYPDEFDVFKPSIRGNTVNPVRKSNKEVMVNSYDNSILYTDYILDSVISLLAEQEAVSYMLYVSDHGEDLFDDERAKSLHNFTEPSRYVAQVPLIIWTSPQYDAVYKRKRETLTLNIGRPISADNVFETLLDMADLSYPGAPLQKSFANPQFKDSKQRVLGGNMELYNFRDLR